MPNRVEREIEEILSKLDGVPPSGRAPTRLRRPLRSRVSRRFAGLRARLPVLPKITPGNMMLAGITLILAGLVLRLFSSELTRWAVIVGLVLFFASFIMSFWPNRGGGAVGGGESYWRGQRIPRSELRGPSIATRIANWWRRRNRRR